MSPIALQVVLTLAAPALTALVGFVAYRHLRNAETDESKARTAKLIEEAAGDLVEDQRKAVDEALASLEESRKSSALLREQVSAGHAVTESAVAREAAARAELAALRAEKAETEAEWRVDRHKLGNQIQAQDVQILTLEREVAELRSEIQSLKARAGDIDRRAVERRQIT